MEANAPHFKLILGSSSTARRKILADMGYHFTTMSADIDEKAIRKEKPEDLVMALAEAKVVVYEGVVREKPSSEAEARQFMKDYANGHAATVSSVLVTNLVTGSRRGEWDKVEVPLLISSQYSISRQIYFHDIPDQVIDKLIEEGIVLYAAGGLIIEHPLILPYVKEVVGSTDSVMGLPKALTERLIKEVL
ncbi:uncharacterized protein LOC132628025 isoform X7 [Lycium barbarum]|uniref:uncharacterized protein LOC132628025 isoform X7 n=1 Tax=Lycium barbarum TaxID=112863 RepID=UPI00293E129E|nr:uncharacterized protein LOC132628025 isoform X7 [Lycium barbarum]